MDYEIGTCSNCGGILYYVHSLEKISCDTCEQPTVTKEIRGPEVSEKTKQELIKFYDLNKQF